MMAAAKDMEQAWGQESKFSLIFNRDTYQREMISYSIARWSVGAYQDTLTHES